MTSRAYAKAVRASKGKYRKRRITEDDPRWNWRTMGNRDASVGQRIARPRGRRRRRRNPW